MKRLFVILACLSFVIRCQNETLSEYASMDIPQTKLGVLFIQNIFEDTPFGVKLLDASDFK